MLRIRGLSVVAVGGTDVLGGAFVAVFALVFEGTGVLVGVIVGVPVSVGVEVSVGVFVRVDKKNDVLVGRDVDDGNKELSESGLSVEIVEPFSNVLVHVGGNCLKVAVWVGKTRTSGNDGGDIGLRLDCGLMKTIKKKITNNKARNTKNPDNIFKIKIFIVTLL